MPIKGQQEIERMLNEARNMLFHGEEPVFHHLYPTVVIFNPPVTVVYFNDGSKTVVHCSKEDTFDKEKGLAIAIVKRVCGNTGGYNEFFHHFIDEENAIDYTKKEDKPNE